MNEQFVQQAHRDYLESRILSAHPVEVVHMLYGVAIESVKEAIAHFQDGDIFARGKAVTKAQTAVDELTLSLDHTVGAPFTRTLAELYDYIQRQLTNGHLQKSKAALEEALVVLNILADGWSGVKQQVCGGEEGVAQVLQSGLAEPKSPSEALVVAAAMPNAMDQYSMYDQAPEAAAGSRDWSG